MDLPRNFSIGMMRHQLLVETKDGGRDTTGGETESWITFAGPLAAYIEATAGRERFSTQQYVAESTHVVVLRYLDGITPKMRLNFGGRLFDILRATIEPMEIKRWTVIEAREIV